MVVSRRLLQLDDLRLINNPAEIDELFVEDGQYNEIDSEQPETTLRAIKQEDIQLVCYEWFKPQ